MPNRENLTKLSNALRSGEYRQGMGMLRTKDNEFCCLGVACDLYAKENGLDWQEIADGSWKFNGYRNYLPSEVASWLGIDRWGDFNQETALSSMNDAGATFEEIADIIDIIDDPNIVWEEFH